MEFASKERFEEAERIEKVRNKMIKYILYKKRTEQEVRMKFEDEDQEIVEDAIEYFKEQKYIDDNDYIVRSMNEFKAIKHLSIKEVVYKLTSKGVNKKILDEYICQNKENMLEYEISSAKAIILKKRGSQEDKTIRDYLFRKGYMSETVNIAFDDLDE